MFAMALRPAWPRREPGPEAGAAPVRGEDEHPAHRAEARQDPRVLRLDRRLLERLDEALAVDGHVIDVLLQGHALLEPLLGHHSGYPTTAV